MASARFLAGQCIEAHQLTQLKEIGHAASLVQFGVVVAVRTGHAHLFPELLADGADFRDGLVQSFRIARHAALVPHHLAETSVEMVHRLRALVVDKELDAVLHILLRSIELRRVRGDLACADVVREVVADGVRDHEVAVCQTLHQCRSTKAVGTVVAEVGFAQSVKARNGGHQLIIHPQAAHGVVHRRVDLHRHLIRVLTADLHVHVEEVAILLLHHFLAHGDDGRLVGIDEVALVGLNGPVALE